ncbi:AAA family ATPase [Streptomyces sp. NPDC051940]|uniref:AAA family ATPase n=1 Tax=Streptomyces sp. NPDC051940 TaxID=3155675 RepID=UPI003438708A
MLLGRRPECARLDALLSSIREGRSEVLVISGEAGVGKTALLDYALQSAPDVRTLRVAGVEPETELPHSALHQLCLPLLSRIDSLPVPQAEALATMFGLRAGESPSPFLAGLGVLNLLAEVAREQPMLVIVDDAHWLDEASTQVLAFVARRLRAESILLLIAGRHPILSMRGLSELVVPGLGAEAARQLLDSVVRWPLDDDVRSAILAEARGNPLALLELPLAAPEQLAGGFGLLESSVLSGRIEESFLRRIAELPADSRDLLLLAAADSAGDPVLFWRAAAALGVPPEAAGPAEQAELLTIGVRIAFRHPLVRSAVYRAASADARRRAHRALAAATSRASDPDRRAWHLAHATEDRDEAVAAELETSADRAQARGGLAAAAAFLERSAALTADPELRAERVLAAARAKYHAGALEGAQVLLDKVEAGPPDDLRAAHVRHLRGHLAFATGNTADAPGLLLETARHFQDLDPVLSRETFLDAIAYSLLAGRFSGTPVAEVAAAAATAPLPESAPRPQDLLLNAYAVLFTEGRTEGTPLVRRALEAFRRDELPPTEAMRWLTVANHGAYDTWDDAAWEAMAELNLRHARVAGALVILPVALIQRLYAHLHCGEFEAATGLLEESEAVAEATGIIRPSYGAAAVAAWRGRETQAAEAIRAVQGAAAERGEGIGFTMAHYTNAVLNNGLGRFVEARNAAALASADPAESAFAAWALTELVEAAVRCDERDQAVQAVERLAESTVPSATEWGLGAQALARALISDDADADAHYRAAIDRLGRSRGAFALARAHLLYGEWLRLQDRGAEARHQLSTAHGAFARFGAEGFTERARGELAACGVAVSGPTAHRTAELTDQERQIARRAREGGSNAEIGAELFISARTVEWHLSKVFTKLGISSRRDLRTVLS